jgi:broad specificity phosphatase PhoE
MRICLLRHAQACWQVQPGDDLDTPLTETGHKQAHHLGVWLSTQRLVECDSRIEVATISASPLRRALQTAEYASRTLELPIVVLQSLREAPFHVADDLPTSRDPLLPTLVADPTERYAAFQLQAKRALQDLVNHAENGPILAFTHGGLIKTLMRVMVGSDAFCLKLYNTALNIIEWRRGRWHIVHVNLWDHLPFQLRTR